MAEKPVYLRDDNRFYWNDELRQWVDARAEKEACTQKMLATGEVPWWVTIDRALAAPPEEQRRVATEDILLQRALALSRMASHGDADEEAIGDLMALDVTQFTDEHCPWCYATYDHDAYAPTFHRMPVPTAPSLLPTGGGDDECMGPCLKCRNKLQPTECKRCGAKGVTFTHE